MTVTAIAAEVERECTGLAASWCPLHGDCTCPRNEEHEICWHFEPGIVSFHGFPAHSDTAHIVTHYDDACPLHGSGSEHAEH